MEYFLIRLSYQAAAWSELVATATDVDTRLASVRGLVAQLGGSFAHFHFFEGPHFAAAGQSHVIEDKFFGFGEDDVITVVALPDNRTAQAFSMAIAAESGVRQVNLTPLVPIPHAIEAMGTAREARSRISYAAPGRPPTGAPAKRRAAKR